MTIRFNEGYFPSHNQTSQVYYCHYTPDMPKAVILLVHGMGSYATVYDGLARVLCENGYAVYAYDLVGHGRSVGDGEIFGSFSQEDGDVVLVKDMESMTGIIRKRFRQLPLFVYAHSLGSFIARAFAATHPDVFDGMVLSGTIEVTAFSYFKRRRLLKLVKKAGRSYSAEVEKLMLGKLIAPFRDEPGTWLTTSPESFVARRDDPYLSHRMTADAYGDIYRLIDYISSDEWLEKMPHGTPILFQSGERDPLGGARGIPSLAEEMLDDGFSKVTVKLYKGEKHELLSSLSHDTVVADLLSFMSEEADAVTAMRRQTREVFV